MFGDLPGECAEDSALHSIRASPRISQRKPQEDSAHFYAASSLIRHSTFELRHLPKTLRPSHRLCDGHDGTFSHPCARRESPQPNTENGGNDESDPAHAHRNRMRPDSNLEVLNQSDEMSNCKDCEEDARDA